MEILPAIDLKGGAAVRLTRGAMDSAKIYSNEPLEMAKKFEDLGAKWLHIVDLDGAFAGQSVNFGVVEKIAKNTALKIEVGGGIRDEARIKSYENVGAGRVILGSIALKNPDFVKNMAAAGHHLAVGIDAINGFVAVEGWAEVSEISAVDLAKIYANAGVEAIIATDISQDGTLGGVNVEFCEKIAEASGIFTIASGGVAGISDILAVKNSGKIGGVIVGKAFYEGRIDLKRAFGLI